MIDLQDVQGLVFAAWAKKFPVVAYVFVRLPPVAADARAWLDGFREDVSFAGAVHDSKHRTQIAISMRGLEALGVPDEVIQRFPQEASVNMHGRSRTLGDEGLNAPANWTLWKDEKSIHALLMLFACDENLRTELVARHEATLVEKGGAVVTIERSSHWATTEPFGFVDGLSQPFVAGSPPRKDLARAPHDEIPTGEILLGYKNGYGFMPQSPTWGDFDLGKNGTYVVFRKLEQDVGAFWRFFEESAKALAGQPPVPKGVEEAKEWLAARAMGRWRNGTSLAKHPHAPGGKDATDSLNVNAFQYFKEDPRGEGCPFGAHVRRANPRDGRGGSQEESLQVVNRHRILRRGRAFGRPVGKEAPALNDDGSPQGLLFVALQASIARGFEFIQQTWNANPGFHGLVDESDPVTGVGERAFTIPASPVRLRLQKLPQFVINRGGGYLFLPSKAALERLARADTTNQR